MVRRLAVLLLLLATGFAASKPVQSAPVNLAGSWRLDAVASTLKNIGRAATQIVITQSDDEIQFDYVAGEKSLGSDVFALNGRERQRYSSRVERAYSRARFNKNQLTITTRGVLDVTGEQQYTDTETWTLSPDGKTLTNDPKDGNLFIYRKDTSAAAQAQ